MKEVECASSTIRSKVCVYILDRSLLTSYTDIQSDLRCIYVYIHSRICVCVYIWCVLVYVCICCVLVLKMVECASWTIRNSKQETNQG